MIDSNTFIVEHQGTTIIVDAGAPVKKVLNALDGRKPSAILVTHNHYDHVNYLDDYANEFGCEVHAPKSEKQITIGSIKVEPLLCPGHSEDSVCYLIEGHLFTGDVLFSDTIGRTDFMKNGPALMQETLKRLLGIKFKEAHHGHYESSTYDEQIKNIKSFL